MSPARLRKREGKHGTSWQVVYRRGGRAYPIESLGTFRVRKDALLRRDLVGGWLAQGLNPKVDVVHLSHRCAVADQKSLHLQRVHSRDTIGGT